MLDIGIQELLVVMVLALLIFGPDKLPDLGRRLGRAMREFRRASDEFRSTVEQNLQINADHDITPPPLSPIEPAAASPVASGTPEGDVTAGDGQGAGTSAAEPAASGAGGGAERQMGDDLLEPYWTSRGGRLLHRRECAWRARVPASERIPLKTAPDGWEQGLKACPVCDPPVSDAKEVAVAS
jgi:TatA/E family protein of Tat protein translocase